ncbi:hypothetical protein JET18_06005 [Chryseobacterium sp. L7]|uniref:Uncharacterized protein n=1 Tax=Chryseobacterium endalhagicum TaxID=2797638 RepID=A0ABS1QCP4_9FLAO|nr:hypothetical protein [Chryseobacterium endalhagicum]MBL1220383.1 hypothetical protein [Chryseobacterium endalhagicum]
METKNNIGEWTATVKNEGKTPQINVNGKFPTNGEKPLYQLIKNDPQGINDSELLLTLIFGNLATPEGTVFFSVHFNEAIASTEKYKTVLVIDENGRNIANIDVINS